MKLSLRHRTVLIVVVCNTLACIPLYFLTQLSVFETLGVLAGMQLLGLLLARILLNDYKKGIDALETGLLNIKDGEYSTTLAYEGNDEFADLCQLYNETVEKLRIEKHWLYQRELLLDKVTQSSPSVLLLINDAQQVIFSNLAAREFFNSTRALEGNTLEQIMEHKAEGVSNMIRHNRDGLFTIVSQQDEQQTWHISNGKFRLNNQPHRLIVLKQLTRELSRQEVAVWKKVIRIISHELNNSLGPINSMLNSGQILAKNLQEEKLSRVFATIQERITHLSEFVYGYGRFAKLPEPKVSKIQWEQMLGRLHEQWAFNIEASELDIEILADPIQLEQLLINLLKNAHESGSCPDQITISARQEQTNSIIEVNDAGSGMSDSVLSSALIPFYSTKTTGSGLGLALCREIVDAHHGQIVLRNRKQGGLSVRISLPRQI